jgi:hypothetical protein
MYFSVVYAEVQDVASQSTSAMGAGGGPELTFTGACASAKAVATKINTNVRIFTI